MLAPESAEEVGEALAGMAADGRAVRPVGTSTRRRWVRPSDAEEITLTTRHLDRIIEHNSGDFTAVLGSGLRLADAQSAFAETGQWLPLDPPEGPAPDDGGGTIGGLVATADSGPARHHYGAVRDLVIGMTVALSDGTVASAGGRVIKNVAGYDIGKLMAGSYGTLGVITSVAVRLHPLPRLTATVVAVTDDPSLLARVAGDLARRPLEAAALDVAWSRDIGRLLLRFAGETADQRAQAAVALARPLDDPRVVVDDSRLWTEHASGQRSRDGVVLKVPGRITDLAAVLDAARRTGAGVVARAGVGVSWLRLDSASDVDRLSELRQRLQPLSGVVLDGADRVGQPWPAVDAGVLSLMDRVKRRFDPAGVLRPGTYVGGI